jgi:hypothetical protein
MADAMVEVQEFLIKQAMILYNTNISFQGAYPLGLDWSYDLAMTRTVSDFEKNKATTESTKEGVVFLSEKERRKVLESIDEREDMIRTGSFQREKQELSQIRESRKRILEYI